MEYNIYLKSGAMLCLHLTEAEFDYLEGSGHKFNIADDKSFMVKPDQIAAMKAIQFTRFKDAK